MLNKEFGGPEPGLRGVLGRDFGRKIWLPEKHGG
jgi:hypothetical protein